MSDSDIIATPPHEPEAAPAEDRTIIMENGEIRAIGPADRVTPPAGARVMDLPFGTHVYLKRRFQ